MEAIVDIGAIERAYRRHAHYYDLVFGAAFQPGRKAIVRHLGCKAGEHILEVGVGTGLSLPLYPADVRVTGIDISPEMLAQAEARVLRHHLNNVVRLSLMDAENMQFGDNSFDKVIAMHVASVVPNPQRLVDEMRRVCKPDGRIILVNHFHSKNPVMGAVESLLAPLSRHIGFRPNFALDHFLDATGLEATAIRPINMFHFCTIVEANNSKRYLRGAPLEAACAAP